MANNCIVIDNGRVEYAIEDANGNVYATINFNPSDPGIATRGKQALKSISGLIDRYKEAKINADEDEALLDSLDAMADAEDGIKKAVGYMLGTDSTTTIFSHISPIAIMADGSMFVEKVISAIMPEVERETEIRVNATRDHFAQSAGTRQKADSFLATLDTHEAAKHLPKVGD